MDGFDRKIIDALKKDARGFGFKVSIKSNK